MEFQFLIGWLQTSILPNYTIHGGKFQFLIGWLQTASSNGHTYYRVYMFQFLIGWLQTIITF